jgi:hypothetical protein
MKKILILLLVSLSIGFASCEKQTLTPTQEQVETAGTIENEVSIYGEWLLVDGKMYMENLETGQLVVLNHFDPTKTVSSLRYSGIMFAIEEIEINVTTWTFIAPPSVPGIGEFWLNSDSLAPYGFNVTNSNWTIIEHPSTIDPSDMKLGGSARPISAYIVDGEVKFYVHEAYESINGVNWKYFSELTFQKIN